MGMILKPAVDIRTIRMYSHFGNHLQNENCWPEPYVQLDSQIC